MNIGCWNIRGLNKTYKQQEVRSFVLTNKVSLMGIVENKVRVQEVSKSPKLSYKIGALFLTIATTLMGEYGLDGTHLS